MGLREDLIGMGQKAREASRELARMSTDAKNAVLLSMAEGLEKAKNELFRFGIGSSAVEDIPRHQ